MDTKLIDVFVSYSRIDSVRVESWVKRLRQGGIKVWFDPVRDNGPTKRRAPAMLAAQGCEVLVWFVSRFAGAPEGAGRVAATASSNGKAVLIVALDTTAVPPEFDVTLPGVTVIDVPLIGRQTAWEAILKGVRAQGVPWIHRRTKRRRSTEPNVRRSTKLAAAWLRVALVLAVLVVTGLAAFTHFNGRLHLVLPTKPLPPAAPSRQKALLTVVTEPQPTPPPPSSDRLAVGGETDTQLALADPHTRRAIEHVTACIEAATRENGLSQVQIDAICKFWADPTFFEGKGLQDAKGIRASLINRQLEWPKWKETVHHIKAMGTAKPSIIEVIAQTSFMAENPADQTHASGTVLCHYLVDTTVLDDPKITRLSFENQKTF